MIGVPEEEDKRKTKRKSLRKYLEIIVENVANIGKEIDKSRKLRESHTGKIQVETRQDTYKSNYQKLNTKKKY